MPHAELVKLKRRSWLRRVLRAGLVVCASAVTLAVVARLVMTDERVTDWVRTQLQERVPAPIQLDEVELSLTGGVAVRGLVIGPPPGFTHAVLRLKELQLRWSLWDLLRRELVLEGPAIVGLEVALERNAEGQTSLGALMPARSAPPSDKPRRPLEQPALPLHVDIRGIQLREGRVLVTQPGKVLRVDGLGFDASFSGFGQTLELDAWLGVGSRSGGGPRGRILVEQADKPPLNIEPRAGVSVHATGLHDIGVSVEFNATVQPVAKTTATLPIAAHMVLHTDLLAQQADLKVLELVAGEVGHLSARGAVRDFLSDREALQVVLAELGLSVSLDAASPWLTAFVKDAQASGQLAVTITTDAERARINANMTVALLALKGTDLRDVSLQVGGEVPMRAGYALGAGATHWQVSGHIGEMDDVRAHLRNATFAAEVDAPLAFMVSPNGVDANGTLAAKLSMGLREVAASGRRARDVKLQLDAQVYDRTAHRADVDVRLSTAQLAAPVRGEVVTLPATQIQARLRRQGAAFDLGQLAVRVGDILRLTASGHARLGPSKVLRNVRLQLEPVDVGAIVRILPEALRPAFTVAGRVAMAVTVDGVLPAQGLLPAPPQVRLADDWEGGIMAVEDYLVDLTRRLGEGLPLTAKVRVDLQDAQLGHPQARAEGVSVALELNVAQRELAAAWRAQAARLASPVQATDAMFDLSAALDPEGVRVAGHLGAAGYMHAALAEPLADANLTFAANYRPGGDLRLTELRVQAQPYGFSADVHGHLAKALRVAAARAWRDAGMPGVDAEAGFSVRCAPARATQLTPTLRIAGAAGLSGSLSVGAGAVALAGNVTTDALGVEAGTTTIEDMSGTMPVDLRLLTMPRGDAFKLGKAFGFGGGTLYVVAAASDIRERAAAPPSFARLRSYRQRAGLRLGRVTAGAYEVTDLRVDARLEHGVLAADRLSLQVLGGDVVGDLAIQVTRDSDFLARFDVKVSNLDASYFKVLKLEPGPKSELSLDLGGTWLLGPSERDLSLNMNVTKIGDESFDRLLQLLDPSGTNDKIQKYRSQLTLIRIEQIAAWVRYENLNMDLDYSTFLKVPFTDIGYKPIPREMLRRYSLSGLVDKYNRSLAQRLGPSLGWTM